MEPSGHRAVAGEIEHRGLADRLISRRAAAMLGRNTVVSCLTFAVGLLILWLLVQMGMGKVSATALSFIVATTLHYLFGRAWIFKGTTRALRTGYAFFLTNALVGLFVTTALFALLVRYTTMNYLLARILVSVFAGLAVFLLNAILNFRRL